MPKNDIVYSLFDCQIQKMTDVQAETYSGTWVDMPGIRKLSVKVVSVPIEDVMGDGTTVFSVGGEVDKVTFSAEQAYVDLEAFNACFTSSVSSSGAGALTIQDVYAGEAPTYFAIAARARAAETGGSAVIVLYKCLLDSLEFSIEGKKVLLPSFSGTAFQNDAKLVYRWYLSNSEIDISTIVL